MGDFDWILEAERRQKGLPAPKPAPTPYRDFDRLRQSDLAHTLGQRARKRYEQKIADLNVWLTAQRTEYCKAADDELAAELKSIRERATHGQLSEQDLKQ